MAMLKKWGSAVAGLAIAGLVAASGTVAQAQSGPGGPAALAKQPANVDVVTVHSPSIAGNLEGDSADIKVIIALPADYKTSKKRYPVVYFLHGYFFNVDQIDGLAHFGDAVSAESKKGHHFILVAPDGGRTKWAGSMWSSSPTIGDWEGFITKDLVGYVDSHYRTLAKPASRGLGGHSMGGYGTWRIAMKHPGVFGAIYGMSACCMSARTVNPASDAKIEKMSIDEAMKAGFGDRAAIASAAGWSSNPGAAPFYFDWLTKDGVAQPEVVAQWAANAPLAMLSQYVQNLKTYSALGIEIGTQDGLITDNAKLDKLLTGYGLKHDYTTFDGGHADKFGERVKVGLIPFFEAHLATK